MQELSAGFQRFSARQTPWRQIMMAPPKEPWLYRSASRSDAWIGMHDGMWMEGEMDSNIEFKSHVPASQRVALEALLFFNSCQARVSDCIANAVERFGSPEIVADGDRLRIHMKNLTDVQSLFAIEKDTGKPVGVAVYTRQDVEHVTVVHLGIVAEYASGGSRSNEQLLLRLLREVRRSTRRMKGVRRLELYYATRRGESPRSRVLSKVAM